MTVDRVSYNTGMTSAWAGYGGYEPAAVPQRAVASRTPFYQQALAARDPYGFYKQYGVPTGWVQQDSMGEKLATSILRWGAFSIPKNLIEQQARASYANTVDESNFESKAAKSGLPAVIPTPSASSWGQKAFEFFDQKTLGALTHSDLLGINTNYFPEVGTQVKLTGYNWLSTEGIRAFARDYIGHLRQRFNLAPGESFKMPKVTAREYMHRTVYQGNLKNFTEPFKTSKIAGGLGLAAAAFCLYDVGYTTVNAYKNAKVQEDGSLGSKIKTLLTTGAAFVVKAVQALASWQAGGIGFALGASLLAPFVVAGTLTAAIVPIIGGIIVGALAAMAVALVLSKGLNAVLPDSIANPPDINAMT